MFLKKISPLNYLSALVLIFFLVFQGFNLGIYTFDIDEMILTENIHLSLFDYFRTNLSFGYFIKITHWVSENYLGGGPQSWRILSIISYLSLCVLLFRLLYKNDFKYLAFSSLLLLSLLFFPNHYARWGISSYIFSSFILFLSFWFIILNLEKKPRNYFSIFLLILPQIILCFVYIGEALSYLSLISTLFLFFLYKRDKLKCQHYFIASILCGFVVFAYIFILNDSKANQILEPRTSIKWLYYPFSNISSLWEFSTSRLKNIFWQSLRFEFYLSSKTIFISFSSIFLGIFLQAQNYNKKTATFLSLLTTWIFTNLLTLYILSTLGKAPFGDIRYIKALIWSSPITLLLGATFFLNKFYRVTNLKPLKPNLKASLKALWLVATILAASLSLYERIEFQKKQIPYSEKLTKALKEDADVYIADILYKFSFNYLNPQKPYSIISRGYYCDNGKYWDAYGWHPCEEMRKKPTKQERKKLSHKDTKKILLATRGFFNKKSYPFWYEELIEKLKFKEKNLFISRDTRKYIVSLLTKE